MIRIFKLFIVLIWLSIASPVFSANNYNLIIMVPDDHARRAMGAYGDSQVLTPNLDQLASHGVRFDNAYAAAPVCSPSRAAMLSGQYPSQVGISDFLMLNENYSNQGMDENALIWPQVLQDNGYETGLIGKWHLGELPKYQPQNRGFNYFVSYNQDLTPFNPLLNVNGTLQKVSGHTSNIFADYAIQFLRKNQNKKFALTIAFREPQVPWNQVPEEDLKAVEHIDPIVPEREGIDQEWLKKITRNNYASIHALDRSIGRILSELDDLGLSENTMVIYIGDHGMLIGHHGYYGRGAVGVISGDEVVGYEGIANLYDEAIKIPFIIRSPALIEPGQVINTPVSNIDIFPSIMSALEIKLPEPLPLMGIDLMALLNEKEELLPRPIYAQYSMRNFGRSDLRMIKIDNWKLVKRFNLKAKAELTDELYNLEVDPGEQTNLINEVSNKSIYEKLNKLMYSWMKDINDPVLSSAF
jgi:choline-sulfatase